MPTFLAKAINLQKRGALIALLRIVRDLGLESDRPRRGHVYKWVADPEGWPRRAAGAMEVAS